MTNKKYATEEERLAARNASHKKYREKNLEAMRNRCKVWYYQNLDEVRLKNLFRNARTRAKRLGLEFSITIEDIVIPEYCPIFGIKIESGFDSGRENSPSVDRIIPEKGYTKDNIQVISYLANRVKNNATLDQLIQIGEWAKTIKEK
jgi:hypothetical protein